MLGGGISVISTAFLLYSINIRVMGEEVGIA